MKRVFYVQFFREETRLIGDTMKRRPKSRRFTAHSSVRHSVATEAARLLYRREFKEYFQAKREAARRQGTTVLPTNQEIHRQLLVIAEATEGQARQARLQTMREAALSVMESLQDFRPRLIGSVWTGHIRAGSDIDIHLYCDDLKRVELQMEACHLPFQVYHVRSKRDHEVRDFVHIKHQHRSGFEVEMTLYPESEYSQHPKCSITGGPMARASIAQLRQVLATSVKQDSAVEERCPDEELQATLATPSRWSEITSLLPELAACRGVLQNHYHHLDVFDHTWEVCRKLWALRSDGYSIIKQHRVDLQNHLACPGPGGWQRENLLIMSALCHDIGKPTTASLHRSGRRRFLGHESVGAGLVRQIVSRLDMQPMAGLALERMVSLHMEPVLIPSRQSPASVLHRLFKAAGDLMPELLLLSWADVNSARGPAQTPYRFEEQLTFVEEMMEEYFDHGFLRSPAVPVSSTDLEQEFGVTDAKLRAKLLEQLTEDYLDGEFQGREDGLSWASDLLETATELW